MRTESPSTRFYQSSSTDMFGSRPGGATIHDETSAFMPQSPYAAAKAAAHVLCDAYRRAFGLRVACGILSNHESRPAAGVVPDRQGRGLRPGTVRGDRPSDDQPEQHRPLRVGNLAVRREWGFAPDYVDGMIRICRQIAVRAEVSGSPVEDDVGSNYRDYVLGTGQQNAVWELIDRAFELAGARSTGIGSSADPAEWTARPRRDRRAVRWSSTRRSSGTRIRPRSEPIRSLARNELALAASDRTSTPSSRDMLDEWTPGGRDGRRSPATRYPERAPVRTRREFELAVRAR